MKNRLLFIAGLAFIIFIIWATTMLGIKYTKKITDNKNSVIFLQANFVKNEKEPFILNNHFNKPISIYLQENNFNI